ncbi:MAG: apolipoprotein N-acyltransferase [Polyangiaceae bacterium]
MSDERSEDDEPEAGSETASASDDEARASGREGAEGDEAVAAKPVKRPKKRPKKRTDEGGEEGSEAAPLEVEAPPGGRLSNKLAWGLTLVSAILCPVGFVGIGVWPVAFVAWVPLLLALRGRAPKQAALMGWAAGFAMTMVGFYWLVEMLQVFGGFPVSLSAVFAALLCLQKGGRIALFAWLYARATERGYHRGLSALGAFAVSELIYPLLFPWYYGASLQDVPIMMQTADIGGPILVSLVILAFNVGLAELAERRLFDSAPDRRTLVAGLATPLLALGYGAIRMASVDSAIATAMATKDQHASVGIVQGNSPLKGRSQALRTHLRMTEELRDEGVDLVVWSEAAAARSFDATRYERLVQQRISRNLGVSTILGVVIYERLKPEGGEGRRYQSFNTALMTDELGDVTGRYDKQFLLMFGEYLPFGDTFPILYKWSPNSGSFSPGESFAPLPYDDHRISVMICYEDIIPSFVSKLVDEGKPDLLVNMTNDSWFGDTAEPWQHFALAKFRSIEHRLFMVRATNSGVSAIIDANGRVPVLGQTFVEQKLRGDVAFLQLGTVYKKLGNLPWWIVTGVMVLAAFIRRRPKGTQRF